MSSDLEHQDSVAQIPTDEGESKKSSQRILEQELAEAHHALERSASRLLISGFSAGLELGFSLFLMAIMMTVAEGKLGQPVIELLVATMYSFGFIIVVIGRSELFTEQTSLAVLPLLSRQTRIGRVARLWSLVYVSNLCGAAVIAFFIVKIGPELEVASPSAFATIAAHVVDEAWWVILLSGILAGWLMGLLSWLVAAGRDTISQIVIVWLITTAIGLAHLHHSILGACEVLAGVFTDDRFTLATFAYVLLWSTLGNALGGPFFVALLKFGISRPEHAAKRAIPHRRRLDKPNKNSTSHH